MVEAPRGEGEHPHRQEGEAVPQLRARVSKVAGIVDKYLITILILFCVGTYH